MNLERPPGWLLVDHHAEFLALRAGRESGGRRLGGVPAPLEGAGAGGAGAAVDDEPGHRGGRAGEEGDGGVGVGDLDLDAGGVEVEERAGQVDRVPRLDHEGRAGHEAVLRACGGRGQRDLHLGAGRPGHDRGGGGLRGAAGAGGLDREVAGGEPGHGLRRSGGDAEGRAADGLGRRIGDLEGHGAAARRGREDRDGHAAGVGRGAVRSGGDLLVGHDDLRVGRQGAVLLGVEVRDLLVAAGLVAGAGVAGGVAAGLVAGLGVGRQGAVGVGVGAAVGLGGVLEAVAGAVAAEEDKVGNQEGNQGRRSALVSSEIPHRNLLERRKNRNPLPSWRRALLRCWY